MIMEILWRRRERTVRSWSRQATRRGIAPASSSNRHAAQVLALTPPSFITATVAAFPASLDWRVHNGIIGLFA